MTVSVQSTRCIKLLRSIVEALSHTDKNASHTSQEQIADDLERFSLWVGNIGALHPPKSPLSLESRLCNSSDLLEYSLMLLNDLSEVGVELLDIVSGRRDGGVESNDAVNDHEEEFKCEETELALEIGGCITRLFRVTGLIRRSARSEDRFAKALSRKRYQFDDHHDVAHVREVFPKLAAAEWTWLQKRLGRANTERRNYLSYTRDHEEQLKKGLDFEEDDDNEQPQFRESQEKPAVQVSQSDFMSRPSTFLTKASTLATDHITPKMLVEEEDSDLEDDIKSYTTISRSTDGDLDLSSVVRIPNLHDLPKGTKKTVQCSLCFHIKRFKNERTWRHHVFSDLRAYVCTFPDCDSPYFGNINEWFRHEMENHRVSYDCQLCGKKGYMTEEHYIAHIRRKHAFLLGDNEEQAFLATARKPLDRLQPSDCPCCTDWVDRLRARTLVRLVEDDSPNDTIYVTPDVFKRHLASHLEQLALFSLPMPNVLAEEGAMTTATDDNAGFAMSHRSTRSLLSFGSPRSMSRSEPAFSDHGTTVTGPMQTSGLDPLSVHSDADDPAEADTSAMMTHRALSDMEKPPEGLAKSATQRLGDWIGSQRQASEASLESPGVADPGIGPSERESSSDDSYSKALPNLSENDGSSGPRSGSPAAITSFETPASAVLLDTVAVFTQDEETLLEVSSPHILRLDSSPTSPALSSQTRCADSVGSTDSDSPIDSPVVGSNVAESVVGSLLPLFKAATSSEDKSCPDLTPYPAFLQPRRATKLDTNWNDLEWAQMHRLREAFRSEDGEEPSQWARCNGEPYDPRNRYLNVDPYQANRVRLAVPEDALDYINASPITLFTTHTKSVLRYIATQGPKANSWSHFWRMLWHETQSPAVVVMITKTHEVGREKCYPYYPQSTSDADLLVNEDDEFGDDFVHNLHLAGLSHDDESRTEIREIEVTPQSRKSDRVARGKEHATDLKHEIGSRKVWHLLFEGWPDFSIPEGHDKNALLNLIELSHRLNAGASNPRIVHCSAGIGRTGTFIALDWLLQELDEGSLDDPSEYYDPIMRVIRTIRDQRPMMVQSKQQFLFLYNTLRERWRERWITLHPEEAKKLEVAAMKGDVEDRVAKRQRTKEEYDSDAAFVDADERAKLEAEPMGSDYE